MTRIDKAARPGRHTSFDRPSLFAQDAADEQADVQRVPILSTLDFAPGSAQGSSHGAHKPRRGPTPQAHETPLPRRGPFGKLAAGWGNWQAKALMALMAGGIVSLLTAFVLLLLDRNAMHDAHDARLASADMAQAGQARPIPVDRRNPLAALVAPTSLPALQQAPSIGPVTASPQAAVIEDLHDNAAISTDTLTPSSALAIAPAAAASPRTPQNPLAVEPPGAGPVIPRDKAIAPPATKRPSRPGKDEDVALLEAVLAHSASRQAPAPALSVPEELRRCGQLDGAAAATCRARICVGNPTATACHQDP